MELTCTTTTTTTVPPEVRKGAWTKEEDLLLRNCIHKYGEGKWHQVPFRTGLNRCRKSCRLRWLNYLKPGIKRGDFATDEVDLIIKLHKLLGNRWSLIAGRLPGRTSNDVKNYWNTHLQKKMVPHGSDEKAKKAKDPKISTRAIVIRPQPLNLAKSRGGWYGECSSSSKVGASYQEENMGKPSPSPSPSLHHDRADRTDDIGAMWCDRSGNFDTEINVNEKITTWSYMSGWDDDDDDDEQLSMGMQGLQEMTTTPAAAHGFRVQDGYVDGWSTDFLIDVDFWDF